MSGLDKIDATLKRVISALEAVQGAIARVGDYVLELLSRYVEALLKVCRRAATIIYRFLRDLLWNCLRIAWQLFHLGLIILFFGLIWAFGSELRHLHYAISGFALESIGIVGLILFAAALLASLGKNSEAEGDARRFGRHVFALLDLLGVLIVPVATVTGSYRFENSLLRLL